MRMTPEERKQTVLEVGLRLAETSDFRTVSSPQLAKQCGFGHALIFHYFGNMDGVRDAIIGHALETNNLRVIGQAVVAAHPRVANLSLERKNLALNTLMSPA